MKNTKSAIIFMKSSFAFLLSIIFVTACGKTSFQSAPQTAASRTNKVFNAGSTALSCTLSSSSMQVAKGGGIDISYTILGAATRARLDGQDISDLNAGSVHFTVNESKTFIMELESGSNKTSCQTSISVQETPINAIGCQLSANKVSINPGNSVILTIKTVGDVTSATLNNSSIADGGKMTVQPTSSQRYEATVTGASGTAKCAIDIDVKKPAPTCSLVASSTSITLGASVDITMNWQNEVRDASIGTTSVAASGSKISVTPTTTQIYTGSVNGPGGSGNCSVTISVNNSPTPAAPTCILSPATQTINAGTPARLSLTYSGTGVYSAVLDGTSISYSGGYKDVQPASSQDYQATVIGQGGLTSCSAHVEVLPPPPSQYLLTVGKSGTGTGSVTSDDSKINCDAVCQQTSATYNSGATVTLTAQPQGGSTFNSWNGDTICGSSLTCTITMANAKNVYASFSAPPPSLPTCSISPASQIIEYNKTANLVMTVSGSATTAILDGTAVDKVTGGTKTTAQLLSSQTFTGTVTNAAGSTSCTASVSVNPPASCSITPSTSSIDAGHSTTLTMTVYGNAKSATFDGAAISTNGGNKTVSPTTSQSYTGTVTSQDGVTVRSCSATVNVNNAPPAPKCRLTAAASSVEAGTPIALTLTNETPSVSIVSATLPGASSVYTSAPWTTSVTAQTSSGSQTMIATVRGPSTATQTGITATCQVTVAVTPPPAPAATCSSFTSSKTQAKYNDQMTLTIQGTNISSAYINNAVVTGSSTTIRSQLVYAPNTSGTQAYNAYVKNSDGVIAYCPSVSVAVSAPLATCSSLVASPSAVSPGDLVTLTASGANIYSANIAGSTTNAASSFTSLSRSVTVQATAGTQTFSATATNQDGTSTVTCPSATVNVVPSPTCSTLSVDKSQVLLGTYAAAPIVRLTAQGTNISRAVINGVNVSSSPFLTDVAIPLNINSQTVTGTAYKDVRTLTATVYNSIGVSASCPAATVTAIGYKIPNGLLFRYKAYDASSRNFYGNAQFSANWTSALPANTFYQQRCESGVAQGYKSSGAVSDLYFEIFDTNGTSKNYRLGDVVAIDPSAVTKTQNVTLHAVIAQSPATGTGPTGALTSFSKGDIQFFFEGGSNTLALSQSGGSNSWPIGVGRGLGTNTQLISTPTSSITYPSCSQ